MTKYKIEFTAKIEREIEVPDGLDWCQAYDFARDVLGFKALAQSSAAVVTHDYLPIEFHRLSV